MQAELAAVHGDCAWRSCMAIVHGDFAGLQVRLDVFDQRLARIEKRLDLVSV